MAWPTGAKYCDALQNPSLAFQAPSLKSGVPRCGVLGFPIGACGAFAVVFKVDCGGTSYAVRCFTRTVTDQQMRYAAISAALRPLSLRSLVTFDYLVDAVLVQGVRYPAVQMEWVDGVQLHEHVELNLGKPAQLETLASDFAQVILDLEGSGLAHGDLQHGNVLVERNGRLRLVDYDGFFVPALAGRPPSEAGHPNYQHPGRLARGHYDSNTDGFSALLITVSILALAADPSLWNYHNGDNLILDESALSSSGSGAVWKDLAASPDDRVKRGSDKLLELLQAPVGTWPAAGVLLAPLLSPGPAPPPPLASPLPPQATVSPSTWLPARPVRGTSPPGSVPPSSWLPPRTGPTSRPGGTRPPAATGAPAVGAGSGLPSTPIPPAAPALPPAAPAPAAGAAAAPAPVTWIRATPAGAVPPAPAPPRPPWSEDGATIRTVLVLLAVLVLAGLVLAFFLHYWRPGPSVSDAGPMSGWRLRVEKGLFKPYSIRIVSF